MPGHRLRHSQGPLCRFYLQGSVTRNIITRHSIEAKQFLVSEEDGKQAVMTRSIAPRGMVALLAQGRHCLRYAWVVKDGLQAMPRWMRSIA